MGVGDLLEIEVNTDPNMFGTGLMPTTTLRNFVEFV
jgi:hypothetical protein